MAFRIEKRIGALVAPLLAATLFAPTVTGQQSFQYEVLHRHSRPPHIKKAGGIGTLTINESGVSFEEKYKGGKPPKHPHAWRWDFQDIQQLKIEPKALT